MLGCPSRSRRRRRFKAVDGGRATFLRTELAALGVDAPESTLVALARLPLAAVPLRELAQVRRPGRCLDNEWKEYYESMTRWYEREGRTVRILLRFDVCGLHQHVSY